MCNNVICVNQHYFSVKYKQVKLPCARQYHLTDVTHTTIRIPCKTIDRQPFKAYWLRDAPTGLTFNNCTLCPHCIYMFCVYLWANSDLCHLQHKLIGFYNRDEKCLQRGTDWVLNRAVCASSLKGFLFLLPLRYYNLHLKLLSTNVGTEFSDVALISNKSPRHKCVTFVSVQGQHAHDTRRLKVHMISRHIVQYNEAYESVRKLGTVTRPPSRQTNIHDTQNKHLFNKNLKTMPLLLCGPG